MSTKTTLETIIFARGIVLASDLKVLRLNTEVCWITPAHLIGMDDIATLPAFLTQREVAELLRLPERTLEDWRQTRNGPPYLKLGRHVRYERADLLTWVREQRHG